MIDGARRGTIWLQHFSGNLKRARLALREREKEKLRNTLSVLWLWLILRLVSQHKQMQLRKKKIYSWELNMREQNGLIGKTFFFIFLLKLVSLLKSSCNKSWLTRLSLKQPNAVIAKERKALRPPCVKLHLRRSLPNGCLYTLFTTLEVYVSLLQHHLSNS